MSTLILDQAAIYPASGCGVPSRESALHRALLEAAQDITLTNTTGSLAAVLEAEMPSGRPDVLVAAVDVSALASRDAQGLAPVTRPQSLRLALALRRNGGRACIDCLFRVSRLRPVPGRQGLGHLRRSGVVTLEDGFASLCDAWQPFASRIDAIEAKVGRWGEAVSQLNQWRPAVDGAWLAFPASYAEKVPVDLPSLRKVGVLGVEAEGVVRILRRPRHGRPNPLLRTLAEEHFYRRWLIEREPRASQV